MIVVVGIGADGMAGLAPASLTELRRATIVYGSPPARSSTQRRRGQRGMAVTNAAPCHAARRAEGDVHVVASGDPLLHGVGSLLIRLYGPDRVAVLPHVSSVTLA